MRSIWFLTRNNLPQQIEYNWNGNKPTLATKVRICITSLNCVPNLNWRLFSHNDPSTSMKGKHTIRKRHNNRWLSNCACPSIRKKGTNYFSLTFAFPYFWKENGTSDELKLRPQKLKKEDTYRIQNKVYFSRVSMSNNEEKKTTQHGFTFRNFTSWTWEKQIYTSHKNQWIHEYEYKRYPCPVAWLGFQVLSYYLCGKFLSFL